MTYKIQNNKTIDFSSPVYKFYLGSPDNSILILGGIRCKDFNKN
jgi:hypothetical protein